MTNQGNTATTATWHDAVYLSLNGVVDSNSILLATQPAGSPNPLAANSSYQSSASFIVPLGVSPGNYSLLVDADYDQRN